MGGRLGGYLTVVEWIGGCFVLRRLSLGRVVGYERWGAGLMYSAGFERGARRMKE